MKKTIFLFVFIIGGLLIFANDNLLALTPCPIGRTCTSVSEAIPDNFEFTIKLSGKILLQVEEKGEAWYVSPETYKRHSLGRPADALQVMRDLGLGVSNKDFQSFGEKAPESLAGKFLLKVEDKGKAFYVNPDDLTLHYLGRPKDALQVMRDQGLGITNQNLEKITPDTAMEFTLAPNVGETNSDPEVAEAPTDEDGGGKPGMNEEGSTQVTRPDSCGSNCSKLYLCKIKCGEDLVNECNNIYSINSMYNLLQCRGECTKYNIVYGCGMESGCDEPCWEDYNKKCSQSAYEDCIGSCEETFGDCNS